MIEQARLYDVDGHMAELYDALETEAEDLALIRRRPIRNAIRPGLGQGCVLGIQRAIGLGS